MKSLICKNLIFDKTHTLSGYPITIGESIGIKPATKDSFKIGSPSIKKLLEEIWTPLRPTIIVKKDSVGDFTMNKNEKKFGSSLLKILNGTYDTRAFFDYERNFWHNELNLFIRSGTCYATTVEKISVEEYFSQVFIFDYFFISLSFIFIIEKLIIHLFKFKSIDLSMNTLRTFIGAAVTWNPKNSLKRIILILIIFPFIIISNYMQGEFSSFITAPPMKKFSINFLEDLLKQYTVYSNKYHRQYFLSTGHYDEIHLVNNIYQCYNFLQKSNKIACANDCRVMYSDFIQNNYFRKLRISTDVTLRRYYAYVYPIDYPLLPRIRKIYIKVYEAGLISRLIPPLRRLNKNLSLTDEDNLRSISLDEIRPINKLLKMGCTFSVILFLTEFIIFKIVPLLKKILY